MLRRISFALVLALLSSGCAIKAYEGPELPKSEIATIYPFVNSGAVLGLFFGVVPLPAIRHKTLVYEIDGKDVSYRGLVYVLPGRHSVKVDYWRRPDTTMCIGSIVGDACVLNYETRDLSISFTAKAGHDYRIPAERRGEKNWIWVEDAKTGKVVAGEKPPDVKAKGKEPATPPE